MSEQTKGWMLLVSRLLIGIFFILFGVRKMLAYAFYLGYMQKNGMPMTDVLLPLAILLELGGGTMMILGWKTRYAAGAFVLFVLAAGLIFHAYWSVEPAQYANQMTHFWKNTTIIAGLLYIIVFGAGPLSLDERKPGAAPAVA